MKKISKREARKAYDNGTPVNIIPYLANPQHEMWAGTFEKEETSCDFDTLCEEVLAFHWNHGCGHRLAYYIED